MAREIVITSVPRGVKLGRTGFQVAMQTAGLRDDLASQLEKMAGYRHLPTGVPNPVCYFHRLTKTFAGQVSVLGRIVDAGVDFSNRSNKLAHMVALEAADMGQVGSSSPAAALAAIEGRLASTWPGPPEERQSPFALAGIPASQAARCGMWQQVAGDAGWAGVLAERAVRGQPTLVIGPDSSPASCRRMLALFQEALAIVPQPKRWSVTFDTTSLSPEGVLWRGTYAGSPESQVAQPGVLVIDLTRPQPIPQNLAAGDLVKIAREGPPAPVTTRPAGAENAAQTPLVPGSGQSSPSAGVFGDAVSGGGSTRSAVLGSGGTPPPAPVKGADWPGAPAVGNVQRRPSYRGLIWGLAACFALIMLAVFGAGAYLLVPRVLQSQALERFHRFASTRGDEAAAPTAGDLRWATGVTTDDLADEQAKVAVTFLNSWLASDEAKDAGRLAVSNANELRKVLDSVRTVMNPSGDENGLSEAIGALCPGADASDSDVVATRHSKGFQTWNELSGTLRQASDRRVARSSALKSIQAYAKDPGKAAKPSKECYCLALDITDSSTIAASYVEFLNRFLERGALASSAVETQQQLEDLLRETKATLSKVSPTQGRGLHYLTEGRGESFSKLLDGLHPDPFQEFKTFFSLVTELHELMELAKDGDREGKQVGENLWKAIVVAAGLRGDAVVEGTDRKVFAQHVKTQDLASLSTLKMAIEKLFPKRQGDDVDSKRPSDQGKAGELQEAICHFRERVNQGTVLRSLDDGNGVELFSKSLSPAQELASRDGVATKIVGFSDAKVVNVDGSEIQAHGGANVFINEEHVITIYVGDKLLVGPGPAWEKHKPIAKFLPIFFKSGETGAFEPNDWIVLSPPEFKQMPNDGRTLHDLLCGSDQSVPLKMPSKVTVDRLEVVDGPLETSDDKLSVRLRQRGGAGLSFLLEITGTVAGRSYTLAEPIEFDSNGRRFKRGTKAPWSERASRFGKLANQKPENELIRIGFKEGKPSDTWPNPESNFGAMVSVLLNKREGEWATLRDEWCGHDRTPQGGQGAATSARERREYPNSLEGWRKKLQDYLLARDKEGFASDAIARYRKKEPPKDEDGFAIDFDPGDFSENPPSKGTPDYIGWEARKDKHRRRKDAWDKWVEKSKGEVINEVSNVDALRAYLDGVNRNREQDDPNLAAVKVLLELDGLIVVKVFRDEIDALIKRIPVEALVQGTVKPRKWKGESPPRTASVVEAKLTPAALRPPTSTEVAGDSDTANESQSAGGQGNEQKASVTKEEE